MSTFLNIGFIVISQHVSFFGDDFMYQKERLEQILSIVRQYGYVTVKFLVNELHYSNATVNRDLNVLAQ